MTQTVTAGAYVKPKKLMEPLACQLQLLCMLMEVRVVEYPRGDEVTHTHYTVLIHNYELCTIIMYFTRLLSMGRIYNTCVCSYRRCQYLVPGLYVSPGV